MKSIYTVIRFEMGSSKSDHGPNYELTAKIEEDPNCIWNCQLTEKQLQSKMELSIEVNPSQSNQAFPKEKIPLFFYDIYQSRLQPARRNETPQRLRVDLMVVSRTSLPYATFHNLDRVNLSQDSVASWLTNTLSEHLQKILNFGFEALDKPKSTIRTNSKATIDLQESFSAESDPEDWMQDEESDSRADH